MSRLQPEERPLVEAYDYAFLNGVPVRNLVMPALAADGVTRQAGRVHYMQPSGTRVEFSTALIEDLSVLYVSGFDHSLPNGTRPGPLVWIDLIPDALPPKTLHPHSPAVATAFTTDREVLRYHLPLPIEIAEWPLPIAYRAALQDDVERRLLGSPAAAEGTPRAKYQARRVAAAEAHRKVLEAKAAVAAAEKKRAAEAAEAAERKRLLGPTRRLIFVKDP